MVSKRKEQKFCEVCGVLLMVFVSLDNNERLKCGRECE